MGFVSLNPGWLGDGVAKEGSRLASIVDVGESHRLKAPKKGILGDLRPETGTQTDTPEQQKARKPWPVV